MNFTGEIRRDLLALPPEKNCCAVSAASAMLATGGTVSPSRFEFVSENERVAGFFLQLVERAFGVRLEVKNAVLDPKRERDKLTFSCTGKNAERILRETGLLSEDVSRFAKNRCCALSYLRAAFLGGGSATLPRGGAKTGYHLEFVFSSQTAAEGFCEILSSFMLLGKVMKRGEKYVVYGKNLDTLSDFCSVAGAKGALRVLESVAAEREESNNENRVSNCFAGNADKAAIASAAQVVAFGKMRESGRLASLPAHLRETAEARLKNPALSFSELAKTLGVGKSCLNHRMRKLMEIYGKEGL